MAGLVIDRVERLGRSPGQQVAPLDHRIQAGELFALEGHGALGAIDDRDPKAGAGQGQRFGAAAGAGHQDAPGANTPLASQATNAGCSSPRCHGVVPDWNLRSHR